jgi:hypothetical protein
MPKPPDAVRAAKFERPGEGTEDDMGFPAQADSTEDGLVAAGMFLGEPGQAGFDKLVGHFREDNEIYLFDTSFPNGARLRGVIEDRILVNDQGEMLVDDTGKALEVG